MTSEQLLEKSIGVATNFDEEFITRFKLGQKILVRIGCNPRIYEIICLGDSHIWFYDYKAFTQPPAGVIYIGNILCQSDFMSIIHTRYLSLFWLEDFIKYQHDR